MAVPSAFAQHVYATPDEAASALIDAVARSDTDALRTVLGTDYKRVLPLDTIDPVDVEKFLAETHTRRAILMEDQDKAELAVGADAWTLPIPIVKSGEGWRFDTRAGAAEMRTRRIGRNELSAMQAILAYYDAQNDYALEDRNGDGVLEYAQHFISRPGKHDGLYWQTAGGEEQSPLGPLFGANQPTKQYHGYYFKILKAQGPAARGGAYDYVIGGRMRAGFAAIAWPARYGDSGIMSFMINHDGQIYQKDLGPKTSSIARAMTRFNPDASWSKVDESN